MTEHTDASLLIRIVDDDAVLRDSLAFLLQAAGWNTQTYPDAMSFLTQDSPSVQGCLVLDIRMPKMSGIELHRELNRRGITLPIIFLTAHGEMDMAVEAMKNGAVDFISKPIEPEKLIEAIRNALSRQKLKAAGMETPADIVNRFNTLTSREQEICRELAKGKLNREVARVLHISERTVEGHRASAFKKLGVKTVGELVEFLMMLDAGTGQSAPTPSR